tara:strand:- start:137 stop:484 length:348 start_codon:yes stop_codon:yes gene_type:complete
MMTSGRQRLPETIAARKAVIKLVIKQMSKLVTKQMAKLVITIVIKRLMNRVSQDVAVEGDVEVVAVVGGMIAAPKKKFGLTITKNCRAMVGTLMESEPKGKDWLLRLLRMFVRKV